MFDLQGRLISRIVEKQVLDEGEHSFSWSAARDLESGVYIVEMKTSSKTLRQRIVISK